VLQRSGLVYSRASHGTLESAGCHHVTPRRSKPVRRNWTGFPARWPRP